MTMLTKGFNVVFSADDDVYPDASVFAFNKGFDYEPESGQRVASITRSDLILLPGHGYAISWSRPIT